MTTSPESLREVAAEIIRLYHSPAPIRENLDLIQRHGLAMAQAIVEIGEALQDAEDGADTVDALHFEEMWRYQCTAVVERIRAKLGRVVAAEEVTT